MVISSEVSHDSSIAVGVPVSLTILDGHGQSSVTLSSDCSSSPVEDEPLFQVPWSVVSDSKSPLMSTDMLVIEESSSTFHSRLDLESDSISQWVSWELDTFSVELPTLMITILANIEHNVVAVIVSISASNVSDFHAFLTSVSDVLSFSIPEGDSLIWLISPVSDGSFHTRSVLSMVSVGKSHVSSVELTDRVGSSIEGEPGISFPWLWVRKDESVVTAANVMLWHDGSTTGHSRLDLESNSISKWLMWRVSSWLLIKEPSRVGSLVATEIAAPVSNSLHVSVLFTTWEELEAFSIVVSELVV